MEKLQFAILFLLLLPLACLQGQSLTTDQQKFLDEHAISISSDADARQYSWKGVLESIQDKRIVLIGEFNHGSKEVFQIRNELIRELHNSHDFDVILFESGIGELIYGEYNKDSLTSTQMTYGLFGPWRTKEFRNLMEFIQAEHIAIAGFDVQRTGGSFVKLLDEIAIPTALDSAFLHDLEARFGKLRKELPNRKVNLDAVQQRTEDLMNQYKSVYVKLQASVLPIPLTKSMLILQTLKNRIDYLEYMLAFKVDQNWNKRWAARDSLMADNVSWLADHIYPDQKIIIIGHNYHISRYNEKEEVMGEYLLPRYGDELYAIGIFAASGEYLNNYGKPESMTAPDSSQLDIKHIIAAIANKPVFLPISSIEKTGGSDWLDEPILINDTFIDLSNSNTMILRKSFDGLLLLDQVSVPEK
jgi:erythromycin esterase-like protein